MTGSLLAASSNVNVHVSGLKAPSSAVLIIVVITVLAIAPAILVLTTGFTRVFIVLSLTRNALGTQSVADNLLHRLVNIQIVEAIAQPGLPCAVGKLT